MRKFLLSASLAIILLLVSVFVAHNRYVLDSGKLDAAIKKELPLGTPKTKVIQFIQARKPIYFDDLGPEVKVRMTGRAENLIYRKDIVLDFQFDPAGGLLSYSKKEYLSFI